MPTTPTVQVRLHEQVVDDLRLLRVAWKAKSISAVVRRMIDQEPNRFERLKALNIQVQGGTLKDDLKNPLKDTLKEEGKPLKEEGKPLKEEGKQKES